MKLIIDIPDEVLTTRHYCQYFGAWSTKLTETIENGKPYEERPQGKWEKPFEHNGKMYHKCDHCHISIPFMFIDNYCPNCGAKMQKGGKEK